MKLAIQHHLLPGKDLSAKFAQAAEYGFQGVELTGWGFDGPMSDHLAAIEQAQRASGLPVSSLCSHRP
ncbi:MAG: sugar phosphate isomerase/epimerase, partial [Anaerolineae bacterium]|nr:sugar phosphate isomerase/epimerase [Anaerolineae bacterium]